MQAFNIIPRLICIALFAIISGQLASAQTAPLPTPGETNTRPYPPRPSTGAEDDPAVLMEQLAGITDGYPRTSWMLEGTLKLKTSVTKANGACWDHGIGRCEDLSGLDSLDIMTMPEEPSWALGDALIAPDLRFCIYDRTGQHEVCFPRDGEPALCPNYLACEMEVRGPGEQFIIKVIDEDALFDDHVASIMCDLAANDGVCAAEQAVLTFADMPSCDATPTASEVEIQVFIDGINTPISKGRGVATYNHIATAAHVVTEIYHDASAADPARYPISDLVANRAVLNALNIHIMVRPLYLPDAQWFEVQVADIPSSFTNPQNAHDRDVIFLNIESPGQNPQSAAYGQAFLTQYSTGVSAPRQGQNNAILARVQPGDMLCMSDPDYTPGSSRDQQNAILPGDTTQAFTPPPSNNERVALSSNQQGALVMFGQAIVDTTTNPVDRPELAQFSLFEIAARFQRPTGPGNSGQPVFNSNGELVGLHSASSGEQCTIYESCPTHLAPF